MKKNNISRRGFLGSTALVAAGAIVAPTIISCTSQAASAVNNSLLTADGKPNSVFNGVKIGTITYSFRGVSGSDQTIKACIDANVSTIELMGNGLEAEVGAPANPIQRGGFGGPMPAAPPAGGARPAAGAPPAGGMPRMQPRELTDEEKAQQAAYEAELAAFRKDPATMDKWATLAKKFTDAGIDVHILKWTAGNTDELLDYSFSVAKIFGAGAICEEASEASCTTLGAAAARNGLKACYHNHAQYASMSIDEIQAWLDKSPANMLNFDAGHYFGFGYDNSTRLSPIQFIDHFHDRIYSIHLKDKTALNNEAASNQNQVWGQGETPVREILCHIRDNYPQIYCDIELEYSIPSWSNSAKEVNNCVRFAREALI